MPLGTNTSWYGHGTALILFSTSTVRVQYEYEYREPVSAVRVHRGLQAVRFDFSAGDVDGSKECTLENDGAR